MTLKDNEIIAEFMGFDRVELYTDIDGKDHYFYKFPWEKGTPYPWFQPYNSEQMEFNTSWDWLMLVIGKIRVLLNDNELYAKSKERNFWEVIMFSFNAVDITATYIPVVVFIKWYNELISETKPPTE